MLKLFRIGAAGAACLIVLVGLLPTAQAATLTSLTAGLNYVPLPRLCSEASFFVDFGWIGETIDVPNFDIVAMVAADANGVPIAAGFGAHLGAAPVTRVLFGTNAGLNIGINPITARPIKIKVFDLAGPEPVHSWNTQALYDDILGRGAPLLDEMDYDPADDLENCATLPLILPPPPPPVPGEEKVPGPDLVAIPRGAVVGKFLVTTPAYYAPRSDAATRHILEAGKTMWVYGVDASGKFYKVMLSGKLFWVPVNTMGPNPDDVWHNWPLPTQRAD